MTETVLISLKNICRQLEKDNVANRKIRRRGGKVNNPYEKFSMTLAFGEILTLKYWILFSSFRWLKNFKAIISSVNKYWKKLVSYITSIIFELLQLFY